MRIAPEEGRVRIGDVRSFCFNEEWSARALRMRDITPDAYTAFHYYVAAPAHLGAALRARRGGARNAGQQRSRAAAAYR